MQAVAIKPRMKNSIHAVDISKPTLERFPDGNGVLIQVLQVGVDATDQEINEGLYGNSPEGADFLIIGHELFGIVQEVGNRVTHVKKGDYVSCTVRRPGGSIYDQIGRNDITSDKVYYERGINLRHGYMTEFIVEEATYVVKVPEGMKAIGVLAEPASICAKAIEQAYLAQARLQVWSPKIAWVVGSGQIGLLSTMMLKLKGLEVFTIARSPLEGNLKAQIAQEYGAHYISTKKTSLSDLVAKHGSPDLIIEATGNSQIAFECMEHLNLNGALVLTSITGGNRDITIPADKINLEWVLGNKLMLGSVNASVKHFREGVDALATGEAMYPGVTQKILTHPVRGLDQFKQMIELLESGEALKVFMNVSEA